MTNRDQIFKSLSPRRIRTINRGLTNPSSVYFTKIHKGPKVRYFSVIDLALAFINKEVQHIFRKQTNLETAITLCEAAAIQNAEATLSPCVIDSKWRDTCEQKIHESIPFNGEYDLGRFTCKLLSKKEIEEARAKGTTLDWWTWQLNEYYKNVYGYSTQMRAIINEDQILEPSFEDREVIVFDRPFSLEKAPHSFRLEITLNDDTSGDKIVFNADLPFS